MFTERTSVGLDVHPRSVAAYDVFRVEKMSFAKVRDPETAKLVADRSTVVYNSRLLRGIPEEVYRLHARVPVSGRMDPGPVSGQDRQGVGHRQRSQRPRLVAGGRQPANTSSTCWRGS